MSKMNVLLISPLDPDRPTNLKFLMGGENTYTRTMLEHPPKGVQYTHFEDALKKGLIEYTTWNNILRFLIKTRILPTSAGVQCIRLKKNFDLIHCHAFNLKLDGYIKPPVVLSDSSSNILFLRDYLGWGQFRINISYHLKKILVEILGIYDQELNLKEAPLIVWSKFAKKVHTELDQNPKKITVIPPGLPLPKIRLRITDHGSRLNILFIGIWFKRKGGDVLLKAYKKLKQSNSNIKLTIVGQVPKSMSLPAEIKQFDFLPREKLVRKIYPKADVLVLVPPKAEGYGLVVLEAASQGIPSIVTSVYALLELVKNDITGYVIKPGNVNALIKVFEKLIKNPKKRKKMGEISRKLFKEKFWIEITNRRLSAIYKKAIRK